MTNYRTSSHDLQIERSRYVNTPKVNITFYLYVRYTQTEKPTMYKDITTRGQRSKMLLLSKMVLLIIKFK